MKVSEPNGTNTSNPVTVSAAQSAGAAAPAGARNRARSSARRDDDQVQISTLSNALKTLQPAAHAAKLTQLSSAVSAGRYQVDAQVVSHKLIQEHMRPAA